MPDLGCTRSSPVPWGSYFCSYYQTSSQLRQLVSAFFYTGLKDHEGCLGVVPVDHCRIERRDNSRM